MMIDSVEETARCGLGCCVQITQKDGTTETQLLNIDENIPSPTDLCEIYTCTVGEYTKWHYHLLVYSINADI